MKSYEFKVKAFETTGFFKNNMTCIIVINENDIKSLMEGRSMNQQIKNLKDFIWKQLYEACIENECKKIAVYLDTAFHSVGPFKQSYTELIVNTLDIHYTFDGKKYGFTVKSAGSEKDTLHEIEKKFRESLAPVLDPLAMEVFNTIEKPDPVRYHNDDKNDSHGWVDDDGEIVKSLLDKPKPTFFDGETVYNEDSLLDDLE